MKKKVTILLLFLLLFTTPLFAKKYSFTAIPFSNQVILYESYEPGIRYSDCGFGLKASSFADESSDTTFGVEASIESFKYEDFHDYYDFKLSGNYRIKYPHKNEDKYEVCLIFGLGSDFVLRDDEEAGLYFLINTGLEAKYRVNEKFDAIVGLNGALTFQEGSCVFHVNNYIGASCPVRGK